MQGKNYIAGEWVRSSEEFESSNPARTSDVLGRFPRSGAKEVDQAVQAARDALASWQALSRIQRSEKFDNLAQLIKRELEDLAKLVSRECGKALNEGRADVIETLHMVQYVFGTARQPEGQILASEIPEKDAYLRRRPVGVVAAISPWNFPMAIPMWLLGPALLEGNTAVFKPSEDTPAVGQRLIELMEHAGFPRGVVNLVHGIGEEAGEALVRHPDVDLVLFTGSYAVGKHIEKICAESQHKLCACEMGGKNAVIVLDDAKLDLAVNASVLSGFKTTGQRCVSAGRIIVHQKLIDQFSQRFGQVAQRIRIGDPLDEQVFMGPLINQAAVEKFEHYNQQVRSAVKGRTDAEILLDGGRLSTGAYAQGHFVSPFVYRMRHDPAVPALVEEVFSPHVALLPVSSTEEAIAVYNDTDYGLAMAVITEDYRKARLARDQCHYGVGYWNLPCIGAEVHLPFGGVKKSGNGHPSASTLIDTVTHRTAWTINYGEEIQMAQGLAADI